MLRIIKHLTFILFTICIITSCGNEDENGMMPLPLSITPHKFLNNWDGSLLYSTDIDDTTHMQFVEEYYAFQVIPTGFHEHINPVTGKVETYIDIIPVLDSKRTYKWWDADSLLSSVEIGTDSCIQSIIKNKQTIRFSRFSIKKEEFEKYAEPKLWKRYAFFGRITNTGYACPSLESKEGILSSKQKELINQAESGNRILKKSDWLELPIMRKAVLDAPGLIYIEEHK